MLHALAVLWPHCVMNSLEDPVDLMTGSEYTSAVETRRGRRVIMAIDMSIVGPNLKSLREGMDLGQKNVASYLGVDQSLISKFESGERAISADMLSKLSALFCCPVSRIVTPDVGRPSMAFAFRTNGLDGSDLKALAVINKIALNQLQMDRLAGGTADA